MGQFLGPETKRMCQFLGPENAPSIQIHHVTVPLLSKVGIPKLYDLFQITGGTLRIVTKLVTFLMMTINYSGGIQHLRLKSIGSKHNC